jgi:hypothetical protein
VRLHILAKVLLQPDHLRLVVGPQLNLLLLVVCLLNLLLSLILEVFLIEQLQDVLLEILVLVLGGYG